MLTLYVKNNKTEILCLSTQAQNLFMHKFTMLQPAIFYMLSDFKCFNTYTQKRIHNAESNCSSKSVT